MKLLDRAKLSLSLLMGRTQPVRRDFWKGGEVSRLFQDWVVRPIAADDEIRGSLTKLRARGRDLGRNSAIAKQYLNLLTTNVIGPHGYTFQAEVKNNSGALAKPINDKIEAAWERWSRCVSLDGQSSLTRLQHVALRAVARDGEVLVRKHRAPDLPFGFALELVDPDLLDEKTNRPRGNGKNEIRMGVELDDRGRRVAYHIWSRPETSVYSGERSLERVPAEQVIHLYDQDRVAQTRGVTWFAPVMLPMRMLDGYIEAAVVGARIGASAMGWFTRKEGVEAGALSGDSRGNFEMDANPGTFNFAPDGYDLSSWAPENPSPDLPAFVKAILRQIAAGLGVSYNALANDLEGVNYSSMRSGLLIERESWRTLQEWWECSFLRPVFEEWMSQAFLTNELVLDTRDPRKFLDASFTARGWGWVDPTKEIAATVLAINNNLDTFTDALAEQGVSFEKVLERKKAELELAKEYGVDLSPAPAAATKGSEGASGGGDGEDGAEDSGKEDSGSNGNGNGRSRLWMRLRQRGGVV